MGSEPERAGLWNVGKGHPPRSSLQGLHHHPPELEGQTSRQPSLGAATFPKAPGTEPLEGDRSIAGDQGVPKQPQPPETPPQLHTAIKMEETPEIKPNSTGEQRLLPLRLHPKYLQATTALCSQEASRMLTWLGTVTNCATSDTLVPLARALCDPQAGA